MQHAWAEIEHDLGYKSKAAVPQDVRRRFSRLAGLLEIADVEFQAIHDERAIYTTHVTAQIKIGTGNLLLDQVSLVTYIQENEAILELDEKLALILHGRLDGEPEVSISYAGDLASAFASLAIQTIGELNDDLLSRKDSIVEFALQLARRRSDESNQGRMPEFPHGISLFYLSIIMAVEMFDEGELEAWVVRPPFSFPSWVASEYCDAFNEAELG